MESAKGGGGCCDVARKTMIVNEVDLTHKDLPRENLGNWSERRRPDMTREPIIEDIIKKVESKEKVFVKFSDGHEKRPGAIALIRKITGTPPKYNEYDGDKESDYTFHLKWDDRKNTTKVRINYDREVTYLPDYTGNTVWSMFDDKQFTEDNAEPVYDRLGNELKINDTVVYVNARYGIGAMLDLGVVREIIRKAKKDHYRGNRYVETSLRIETIVVDEGDSVESSKIKAIGSSVMKITDVDLFDEAFVRKLTITQK